MQAPFTDKKPEHRRTRKTNSAKTNAVVEIFLDMKEVGFKNSEREKWVALINERYLIFVGQSRLYSSIFSPIGTIHIDY